MKPRIRFRRFQRRPKKPIPRFRVGDVAGKFTVIGHQGHSPIPPTGEVRALSQAHHWYLVKCTCGNEESHTQQQLLDTRRHRACIECIRSNNEDSSE
jgi:hypothetical protein